LDGATSEHFIRSVKGDFDRIVMFEPAAESARKCHDLVSSLDQEFSGKKIKSKVDVVESGLYGYNGELSLAMSLFDQDLTKVYGALPQSAHILDTGLSSAFVEKGEEYNVIKVPVIKLDDYMGGDPATFIKFEIEGSEVSALQGATETILYNKPKMALSIYHRPQDLELIIDYVEGLEVGYKIALRAHNPYTPDAIVLYCWQ
jgi:FkbM family methyltransferase